MRTSAGKISRCPFYGLTHPVGRTFVDKHNNQCALLPDCGRCKREKAGLAANWNRCLFFNTNENAVVLDVIVSRYKVLPHGQTDTIPLREWYKLAMT